MADLRERILLEAVDKTSPGFNSAKRQLSEFEKAVRRLRTTLLGFVGINIFQNLTRDLFNTADGIIELDSKIKLATESTAEYNKVWGQLSKTAASTGTQLEAASTFFVRTNNAVKELGGTTDDTLKLNQLLADGLKISGASAGESASVIRQLSQAMASGVLRGDEYNSVSENGARIIHALSQSLGVNIGQLREMAHAGQLTRDVFVPALLDMQETLREESAQIPLTVGRSIENLKTQFKLILRDSTDTFLAIAELIQGLTANFETLLAAIIGAGKAAALYFGIKLAGYLKNLAKEHATLQSQAAYQLELDAKTAANKLRQIAIEKAAIVEKRTHAVIQAKISESKLASQAKEIATEYQLIRAKREYLALQVQEAKAELLQARTEGQRVLAKQTIIAFEKAHAAAVAQTTALKAEQLKVENSLAAATAKHTLAVEALTQAEMNSTRAAAAANIKAKTKLSFMDKILLATGLLNKETLKLNTGFNKSALSARGAFGYLIGIFTRFGSMLPRIAAALTGLPGLFLFIGYEIAKHFIDMEVAWDALNFAMKKVWYETLNVLTLGMAGFSQDIIRIEEELIDKQFKLSLKRQGYTKEEIDLMTAQTKSAELQSKAQEAILKTHTFALEKELAARRKVFDKYAAETLGARDESFNRQMERLQAEHNLKVELLSSAATYEGDIEKLKVENEAKLSNERLAIRTKFFEESLTKIETLYNTEINKVSFNKNEVVRLIGERNRLLLGQYDNYLKSLQTKLNNELAREADLVASVREMRQSILDSERTFDEERLNFRKDSMSKEQFALEQNALSWQKFRDSQKAILEAEKLDFDTNGQLKLTQFKEERDKLLDLAKAEQARANEYDKSSSQYLTAKDNANRFFDEYTKVNNLAIATEKRLATSAEGAIQDVQKSNSELIQTIETIKVDIDLLEQSITSEKTLNVNMQGTLDDLDKANQRLDEFIAKAKVPIKITTYHETHGTTTLTPATAPVRRRNGGFIPRTDMVPGSGTGDKVKALLEPGEYIINRKVVDRLGVNFMNALNAGMVPTNDEIPKFKNGGVVTPWYSDYSTRFMDARVSADARKAEEEAIKRAEEAEKHVDRNRSAAGPESLTSMGRYASRDATMRESDSAKRLKEVREEANARIMEARESFKNGSIDMERLQSITSDQNGYIHDAWLEHDKNVRTGMQERNENKILGGFQSSLVSKFNEWTDASNLKHETFGGSGNNAIARAARANIAKSVINEMISSLEGFKGMSTSSQREAISYNRKIMDMLNDIRTPLDMSKIMSLRSKRDSVLVPMDESGDQNGSSIGLPNLFNTTPALPSLATTADYHKDLARLTSGAVSSKLDNAISTIRDSVETAKPTTSPTEIAPSRTTPGAASSGFLGGSSGGDIPVKEHVKITFNLDGKDVDGFFPADEGSTHLLDRMKQMQKVMARG